MKFKELLENWEVLVILLVMLFIHGAFYSENFVYLGLGVSITISLTILYRLLTKTGNIQLNWLTIVCWLVALSYAFTLWTTVTVEGSLLKIAEWFTYGLLLMHIRSTYYQRGHIVIRLFTIIFCGVHMLMLINLLPSVNGFFNEQQELSANGLRLNGLLQYANATGAIAATLLLYTLYAHIEKQRWTYVDMILLTSLSYIVLLTESRGALLVLALSFLVGLFIMKQKMHYLLLFSTSMLIGLIAYVLTWQFTGSFGHLLAILSVLSGAFIMEKQNSKWSYVLTKRFIIIGMIDRTSE